MNSEDTRWLLAFDASCGTCRQISAAVAKASEGRLEVLPLTNTDVERWRQEALGADAPPAPTLLKVRLDNASAWTGPGMILPLIRQLGPRATLRVLQSLGWLRHQAAGHPLAHLEDNGIGRKAFLRLGAGAAVAAGMMIAGKAPAFAERSRESAQAWIEANRGNLPQTYDALADYPMAYRRAIYLELPPEGKSRFWLEHMRRYRAAHPHLSPGQVKALAQGQAIAARPSTFEGDYGSDPRLEKMRDDAVREFGMAEAVAIFVTLGPSDTVAPGQTEPMFGCTCNQADDWCTWGYHCRDANCQNSSSGCGTWGGQRCNGLCYD